jgi:peptidoglycan/LPS O-acetylase OafA/YrhL
MLNNSAKFREDLFEAEVVTPALRDAYRSELDAMLHNTLTPRKRVPGTVLLALLILGAIGEVWTMIVHSGDWRFYIAATTMMAAFAFGAAWIGRDLWRGKSVRKSSYKFADLFYGAAGVLTAVQLMHGMFAPGDPKSTFGVLFMFVFLFVCSGWSLINRISSSELSLREELLRIECRMADLAERLPTKERN